MNIQMIKLAQDLDGPAEAAKIQTRRRGTESSTTDKKYVVRRHGLFQLMAKCGDNVGT